MSEPYIAEIRMFAGTFAPSGWAFCDGSILSIQQNTALFSLIGTTYGGNGQTTFALPDLRGRVPIHQGQGPGLSPYVIGQQSGTENVTLTTNQMPQHTHNHLVNGGTATGTGSSPVGSYLANTTQGRGGGGTAVNIYSSSTDNSLMAAQSIGLNGGSQPHSNIQPYLTVIFIIALQGIYPSRS